MLGQARAAFEEAKAQDVQAAADWERAQRLFKTTTISANSRTIQEKPRRGRAALRRARRT